MAQDYAASISGQLIRVTRLKSDGTFMTGASASYLMKSFVSLSFTPEYEDGDEITQKAADGTVCVTYVAPDTLKGVSLEIAICNPDPEFTEILAGGTLLSSGGQNEGWAAPQTGVNATPFGAAVEVWSLAIQNGKPAANKRYWHWVFPYVIARQSGDRVIENGLLANTFEGSGAGNSAFGAGPGGLWPYPAVTDRAYMYARTNTIPGPATNGGANGYLTI